VAEYAWFTVPVVYGVPSAWTPNPLDRTVSCPWTTVTASPLTPYASIIDSTYSARAAARGDALR
jgi:hypothetical protein